MEESGLEGQCGGAGGAEGLSQKYLNGLKCRDAPSPETARGPLWLLQAREAETERGRLDYLPTWWPSQPGWQEEGGEVSVWDRSPYSFHRVFTGAVGTAWGPGPGPITWLVLRCGALGDAGGRLLWARVHGAKALHCTSMPYQCWGMF